MSLVLLLGLMACDGVEASEPSASAPSPSANIQTTSEAPELTSRLTGLVSAAGHTGGLPIEVSISKARYGQAGTESAPASVSDREIIEQVFGSNPAAPLTWEILAAWESSGTQAWLVSSMQAAGAGVYDVKMLTLRGGQYARWSVGSESRINCGESTTFTGTVSESGVLTAISTTWSEQCGDEEGTSDKVIKKVDYGLDGSMTAHP